MDVVRLSPALSPKEIQQIRTRLAPFQTIHFTSAASEEALFRIGPNGGNTRIREPRVRTALVPMSVPTHRSQMFGGFLKPYKPNLIVITFKQIGVFAALKKANLYVL
jgi:hypothetical protein